MNFFSNVNVVHVACPSHFVVYSEIVSIIHSPQLPLSLCVIYIGHTLHISRGGETFWSLACRKSYASCTM